MGAENSRHKTDQQPPSASLAPNPPSQQQGGTRALDAPDQSLVDQLRQEVATLKEANSRHVKEKSELIQENRLLRVHVQKLKVQVTKDKLDSWCHPLWELDSWTYEVVLSPCGETRGRDGDPKENVRVRRTVKNETNMVLLREGAALSALCGVASEDEEDRRDVALAVTMAKMIAFLPFQGIRASSDPEGTMLVTDHSVTDDDDDYDETELPTRSLFRTNFSFVYGTSMVHLRKAAEFAVPENSPFGRDAQDVVYLCIACAATSNMALLHLVAKLEDQRVSHHQHNWYIDSFIKGAAMSDNATSIDLLLRFPPPEWVEPIANFFHLSQGAKHPVMLPTKSSGPPRCPLHWIFWKISEGLPTKDDAISEAEFRTEFLDEEASDEATVTLAQTTNNSALHARLLLNILDQKQYPNCGGGGYMAFLNCDIANIISLYADRIPRGSSVRIGGTQRNRVDFAVMNVLLLPEEPWVWVSLTYAMQRKDIVHLDLSGGKEGGGAKKQTFTKVQASAKAVEVRLARALSDLGNESMSWNNLAYNLFTEDPEGTVEVQGRHYTCFDCGHKALSVALEKSSDFDETMCKWDTIGCILKPATRRPPKEEEEEELAATSTTTHFIDNSGRSFNNLDCVLVALGMDPKFQLLWLHVGLLLWRNAKAAESFDAANADNTGAALLPWATISSIRSTVEAALATNGKKLSDVKTTLPPEDATEVVGAGGKAAAVGRCSSVVALTELECYLVAHGLGEVSLLREMVTEEAPEVVDRFIRVVTADRISEKGHRVIESNMEGISSFEKSYSL